MNLHREVKSNILNFSGYTFLLIIALQCVAFYSYSQTNVTDAQGRKQGEWVKYYSNNQKRYEGTFKDDKPVGTFKYYDEEGVFMTQLDYLHADTAKATHFHTNGKAMSTGIYVKQKRHGEWKFYDNRGVLSLIEHYENGLKQGVSEVFYSDGKPSKRTVFQNDLEQGESLEWFENGTKKFHGVYLDGNLHGAVTFYHPNGEKRYSGNYVNAVKDGRWVRYDENGKPTFHEIYKLGQLKEVIDLEEEKKKKSEP